MYSTFEFSSPFLKQLTALKLTKFKITANRDDGQVLLKEFNQSPQGEMTQAPPPNKATVNNKLLGPQKVRCQLP